MAEVMIDKQQNPQKIMIIIWRWEDFDEAHYAVNDTFLSTHQGQKILKNVVKYGKNKVYDELEVEESDFTKNAKVIRAYIYKGEETKKLLYLIIDQYATPQTEILLFLHRNNFYTQKDVKCILKHKKKQVAKCFLFGEGRDFIYYKTKKMGLLESGGGDFIYNDKVRVVKKRWDDEQDDLVIEKVLQPYFDIVWSYYKHEFKKKIYELQKDLFFYCAPFTQPGKKAVISKRKFLDFLAKNPTLYYRTKSFLNEYQPKNYIDNVIFNIQYQKAELSELDELRIEKLKTLKEELLLLKEYENKKETSFIFDDCNANLEIDGNVKKEYQTLVKKMRPIFTKYKREIKMDEKISIIDYLLDIRKKFENLINKMQEQIY